VRAKGKVGAALPLEVNRVGEVVPLDEVEKNSFGFKRWFQLRLGEALI
jgi:hypothetical protein